MPLIICDNCVTLLRNAYEFRQQCWNSQEYLNRFNADFEEKENYSEYNTYPTESQIEIDIERKPFLCSKQSEKAISYDGGVISQINPNVEMEKTKVNPITSENQFLDTNNKYNSNIINGKPCQKYKPEPKMCELCGKICATIDTLKAHMTCLHENERKFACEICNYRGNRKTDVKVFMITY